MDEQMVLDIIAAQIGVSTKNLQYDTILTDLGADSLDLFQIISALEEAFDLEFDAEVAEQITTVGDVLQYLRNVVESES